MKINITEEQYEKVIKKYLEEEMEDATGDNFERTHRDSPSDWERDYDNHDVTHDDIERIHRHVTGRRNMDDLKPIHTIQDMIGPDKYHLFDNKED